MPGGVPLKEEIMVGWVICLYLTLVNLLPSERINILGLKLKVFLAHSSSIIKAEEYPHQLQFVWLKFHPAPVNNNLLVSGFIWHQYTSGNILFFLSQSNDRARGRKECHFADRLDMLTLLWSEKQLPWQPLSTSGTCCLGELGKAFLFVIVGQDFSLALRPSILRESPPETCFFFRPRDSDNLAQEIPICSCCPPEIPPDCCKIAGGRRGVCRKREGAVCICVCFSGKNETQWERKKN